MCLCLSGSCYRLVHGGAAPCAFTVLCFVWAVGCGVCFVWAVGYCLPGCSGALATRGPTTPPAHCSPILRTHLPWRACLALSTRPCRPLRSQNKDQHPRLLTAPPLSPTLPQMSSLENWSGIMYAAMQATGVNQQPLLNANNPIALYFIAFVIFGVFFILNLVIGVSIDKVRQTSGPWVPNCATFKIHR